RRRHTRFSRDWSSDVCSSDLNEVLSQITHPETQICVQMERNFLSTLEGGCTAPIGAFAEMQDGQVRFTGRLCSLDGKDCIETDKIFHYEENRNYGKELAEEILNNGGRELMSVIKATLKI